VAAWAPRDGNWSGQVHPARLRQVSWTNPLTNKILLEAGLAVNTQLYDFSYMRYMPGIMDIPRVQEFGAHVGKDEVSPVVNSTDFTFLGTQSANLNNGPASIAEYRNLDDYRPRASLSYVTGTHNAKFGYDGGYFSQNRHNTANDLRLSYRYDTPTFVATAFTPDCRTIVPSAANPYPCGNTSRYFPSDPYNSALRPVPTQVTINTGIADVASNVDYSAFYVQDQWTLKRLTLNGAIRYDHATSNYQEVCVSDPGKYIPVQVGGAYNGQSQYCVPASDGVNYDNITPRWGVTWDVFGNGKTSVKYNMGKYLAGAGINGIYADANRFVTGTVNNYTRTWTDADGDRIVDCDLLNFNAQNTVATGGDICGGVRAGCDALRSRPEQLRRGRDYADRSGDHAVRAHRQRHPGGGAGVLCRLRGIADRGLGPAALRVADGAGHPARDPPAPVGRVHLQPPGVRKPDGHRSARQRMRSVQRDRSCSGPADVPGEQLQLHEPEPRLLLRHRAR
jgi:hypothetical protein